MSNREKHTAGIVVGLVLMMSGWIIRTSFIMHSYSNKPVGGIIMAIGMLIIGWMAYKLLKK